MATLIELDRRYRTRAEALSLIPYLPCAAWRVVQTGQYFHLQFETDRPAASVLKAFSKIHPTHTFRVLEADDVPRPLHDHQPIDAADNLHNQMFLEHRAAERARGEDQ